MRTQDLKGWRNIYPKDDFSVIVGRVTPCMRKSRRNCESSKRCVYSMGDKTKGEKWFKECKPVEFKILNLNNSRSFTVLKTSKVKFID